MSEEVPKIVDKCVSMGLLEIQGTNVMLTDEFIEAIEAVIKIIKMKPELFEAMNSFNTADEMVSFVVATSIIYHLKEIREEDLIEILPVMHLLVSRYLILRSVC